MVRAASAGLIGISAVGEAAIQVGNWCARRHPGTPRNRPEGGLSIHSNPESSSMQASPNFNRPLAIADGPVDLEQPPTATPQPPTAAQLVPTIDRNEATRLQNIICQQSNDTSKLLGIIEDLNNKINDMQQHMSQDLARTEEKLRTEYDNMLVNATLRISEEKDKQINLLKMQVAKFKGNTTDPETTQEDVKKELQFQNQIYPQSPDKAKQSEMKTWNAQMRNEHGAACFNMDSNIAQPDKYTDDQVAIVIQQDALGKQFVLLGGAYMSITEVWRDIGEEQRLRALKQTNAQRDNTTTANDNKSLQNERVDNEPEDMKELINDLAQRCPTGRQAGGGSATGPASSANSTPPRQQPRPFNDHDDDDDDDDKFLLSSIHGGGSGKGNGGGDDGDGSGNGGETYRWNADDRDTRNNNQEFSLVNSRNIEIKKFTGEMNSKLSYLEFNDSQRELVAIKGADGDTFNKILTWAEKQGDKAITQDRLQKLETYVPKIYEFNRAIHAALKNWTEGDAKRLIKYEVHGGIDA